MISGENRVNAGLSILTYVLFLNLPIVPSSVATARPAAAAAILLLELGCNESILL